MGWGRLERAPWTLWAYVTLSVIPFGALGNHRWLWLVPVAISVSLLLGYFLLRGIRFFWWFALVTEVGYIPTVIITGTWWEIPLTLFGIALLLGPPSRRYVFPPKEAPQPDARRMMRKAQSASVPAGQVAAVRSSPSRDFSEWDPTFHSDAERPAGWYFAPGGFSRMRHWNPDAAAWQGNARVPGRIRRRAERAAE